MRSSGGGLPLAEPWARVTAALSNAVAVLARELSGGNGASVRAELEERGHDCEARREYGLRHRKRPPSM